MDGTATGNQLVAAISAQSVPSGAVGVWWLGQSSLVLKVAGRIVYVDPYLADDPRRLTPPAFAAAAAGNADLVLLTHDHSDHLDPAALPALTAASPWARVVAPRPIVDRVAALVGDGDRVVAASAGDAVAFGALRLTPVAAKHETFDEDPDLGFPYLGYVLHADGVAIYLAGDTIPYDGLVETLIPFAIDLAFLPINGRDFFRTRRGILGNMDGREAAELAAAVGVDTVVPVHYGMFAGNTVPPGDFVTYLAAHHPRLQAHVLGRGRPFIYQRASARAPGGAA